MLRVKENENMTEQEYQAREQAIKAAETTGPVVGMPCTMNIGSDHYAVTLGVAKTDLDPSF